MSWKKIKKFYAFSKFKLITTIVLFIVIMLPPMIYDDIYFAAPWIWHILAPPMMLEDTALYLLMLPLLILWFYTLASIINKVRTSK